VAKKKDANPKNNTTPPADEDRNARFDRLYPGKSELTLEQYLTKQSDTEMATQRFRKFDSNSDGILTREEFVRGGKKSN
jgi:Ca2+-binding EF-hand superfamily protein